jgi:hypothetical protein
LGRKSDGATEVWHHDADHKTMRLVPKDLHTAYQHTGSHSSFIHQHRDKAGKIIGITLSASAAGGAFGQLSKDEQDIVSAGIQYFNSEIQGYESDTYSDKFLEELVLKTDMSFQEAAGAKALIDVGVWWCND